MGDFSNIQVISKISDVWERLDLNSDTIILNSNCIKKAQLEILPNNIKNVYLDDNIISEISWDDRDWGVISVKNNNFETNEFSDLVCKKFFLDDNSIENITFSNCKFEELSISNNNIKSINFFDCVIKELNLSVNKITEIITLPLGLIKLNCYGNKITNIFMEQLNSTITWIDLSDNKLEKIGKLSENLQYLDLSKNKFKTFDTSILPNNLYYFDITENYIPNNKELFGKLFPQKLFYDTDNDDNNESTNGDNESNNGDNDDKSDLESNVSSDISIKLNKKFLSLNNHYKEFNSFSRDKGTDLYENFDYDEKDDIIDDEVSNFISEYKEQNRSGNNLSFTDTNSPFDSDFLNYKNSPDNKDDVQTNNQDNDNNLDNNTNNQDNTDNNADNNTDNLLSERDKMIRDAINRFRESSQFGQIEQKNQVKNYSKTIPIQLQWNFNL